MRLGDGQLPGKVGSQVKGELGLTPQVQQMCRGSREAGEEAYYREPRTTRRTRHRQFGTSLAGLPQYAGMTDRDQPGTDSIQNTAGWLPTQS